MKKSTKKIIMVLTIVLLFGMSTIAYIINSIINPLEEGFKPLETYIVDYELDPRTEYEYLIRGFTIIKFYYSNQTDERLLLYIDQLPDLFRTNNNQIQLIAQKIPDNRTYAHIIGFYGEEELNNVTEETIFNTICNNIYITPLECGLSQINLTT